MYIVEYNLVLNEARFTQILQTKIQNVVPRKFQSIRIQNSIAGQVAATTNMLIQTCTKRFFLFFFFSNYSFY